MSSIQMGTVLKMFKKLITSEDRIKSAMQILQDGVTIQAVV